jgi:hypothetical protein
VSPGMLPTAAPIPADESSDASPPAGPEGERVAAVRLDEAEARERRAGPPGAERS